MQTRFFLPIALLATLPLSAAAVEIQEVTGWVESAAITWTPDVQASGYEVFVQAVSDDHWTPLDPELVRQYPTCYRADALGLKAGEYRFRIVPTPAPGSQASDEPTISATCQVTAHDRSGFAHVGMEQGLGAYRNDGTLRQGARVLYVSAANAATVTHDVITSSRGAVTTGHGLQDIITLYQKGYDTTPLAIRVIGTIRAEEMDRFDSSAEGLQIKGKSAYSSMPITLEGVGSDATLYGFGILCRNCMGTEIRNLGIMLCMDDCLSLDTENSHVWIHHMDFFYGQTGGDADQAKGDGTVDIKGLSTHVTVSYCHFWDSGKSSLGGMKSETTDCWMSYHHNWFDHSDSRHPRIRTGFYHIYNNYFDGNAKYGVGMTMGGSALVEGNVFRNCKYPMLISRQGTDAEGDGTFSGETGGVIKAWANEVSGARKLQYYDGQQLDGRWDAVLARTRDEVVSAIAYSGGTPYNNPADLAARTTYIEDHLEPASTVCATVTGPRGAGRMQHGDFAWTFDNATDDTDYGVIAGLKQKLADYQSMLITPSVPGADPDEPQQPENPSTDPDDPQQPGTPGNDGTYGLCHFADRKPSDPRVTVSGNYSDSKGTLTHDGSSYNICVKMETATVITLRPDADGHIVLHFGASAAGKRIKLDGTTCNTDSQGTYTLKVRAGQAYTLTKGDSINLFLIEVVPDAAAAIVLPSADDNDTEPSHDIMGRRVSHRSGLVIEGHSLRFVR